MTNSAYSYLLEHGLSNVRMDLLALTSVWRLNGIQDGTPDPDAKELAQAASNETFFTVCLYC